MKAIVINIITKHARWDYTWREVVMFFLLAVLVHILCTVSWFYFCKIS